MRQVDGRRFVGAPSPWVPPPEAEEPYFGFLDRVWKLAGRPNKRRLATTLLGTSYGGDQYLELEDVSVAKHLVRALRPTGYGFDHDVHKTHSLLALSLPFWPEPNERLRDISRRRSMAPFSKHLGLIETHFKPAPAFCLECVKEDLDEHGFSHWRRTPQLAGVRFCPTHKAPLVDNCAGCGRETLFDAQPSMHCGFCGTLYEPQYRFADTSSDRVAHALGVAVDRLFSGDINGPLDNRKVHEHFRSFLPTKNALVGRDLADYVHDMAGDNLMTELRLSYPPRERFVWPMLFSAERFVFGQASHQLLLFAAVTADHPNDDLWYQTCPSLETHTFGHSTKKSFSAFWDELKRSGSIQV